MSDTPLTLTASQRRRSLAALIVHMTAIGLFMGVSFPLTALFLEGRGYSSLVIGVVAAMGPLAIGSSMILAPRLVGRLGAVTTIYCGLGLGICCVVLLPVFPNPWAWCVLWFFAAAGLGLPWLISETWINTIVESGSRGRILAIYAVSLFSGMALGPLVLDATGTDDWRPFAAAALALVFSGLPLIAAWGLAPEISPRHSLPLLAVIRAAPVVFGAACIAGFSEVTFYTFSTLYGIRGGLDESEALRALTVFLLGGIFLQYPLGWLSDHWDRKRTLQAMAALTCGLCLLLPWSVASPVIFAATLFLIGGGVLGFYTLGLALLGQSFRPQDFAVANAGFIIFYEIGSASGPLLTGMAMDIWNPHGFIAVPAAICGLFALIAFLLLRRRRA
ncbi:MAG: MFS transporter [Rhodovibrionaceae bacterium]